MNDAKPSAESGCLALFVATALVALLLTLGAGLGAFYGVVFIVTAFAAALGMPIYALALQRGWANLWTAAIAGALLGAGWSLGFALDGTRQGWLLVGEYALTGTVGGLAFYLTATARQYPRRNIIALLILATIAIRAALLVAPRF